MNLAERVLQGFRAVLPSPLAIALLLTALTFLLTFFLTRPEGAGAGYALDILGFWERGMWNPSLLAFAVQMMLMLVLGHTLARTPAANKVIRFATSFCNTSAGAAAVVTLLSVAVGFINWGLALIFGAVLARKVGEHAQANNIPINYALVGAAGYGGMMVWHGGISGSSLVKVAEPGHLRELVSGTANAGLQAALPEAITFTDTVFSGMNMVASLALLVAIPALMYWLGKRSSGFGVKLPQPEIDQSETPVAEVAGAEKLDYKPWLSGGFGLVVLGYAVYKAVALDSSGNLSFITPDYINFCLLGLGLLLHRNLRAFSQALSEAIGGASGILIQFPLYFGVMGMMQHSGLVSVMAEFFISVSGPVTYPLLTFFSAGLVNFFVPSGGGQWMVQGPLVLEAAHELGIPFAKSIMALAYGDQITNMLQPFWALPLLGITGLRAKDILPYTALMLLVGTAVFIAVMLLF